MRSIVLSMLVAAGTAYADEPTDGGAAVRDGSDPAANRINLRLGSSTSDQTGRPTICMDVRIWRGLGVESCGTGQAIIHNDPGKEMAHFRATWSVLEHVTSKGTARLRGGIGFAELQVGVDHPGFKFGEPDSVDRGSVSGPEAAVQGQFLVPLGKGVEAVASFTAGVAIFAKADQLIIPQDKAQPFVSAEIGLGW